MIVNVRWLTSTEEIEQAERILYICYVLKAKQPWLVSSTNASQIRLEYSKKGELRMTDKYKFSAKWAGAFITIDGKKVLIGIVRLYSICNQDMESMDNKLEMEQYPTFPNKTSAKIFNLSRSYRYRTGVTRLAILPQFRRLKIFKMLLTFITTHMLNMKSVTLTTTHVPFLRKWYQNLGGIEIGQFRYESHDPSDAFIYFFDKNALTNMSQLARQEIISMQCDNISTELISMLFKTTKYKSKL